MRPASSATAPRSGRGFMTIQETADFLNIPKRTLYEWVNQRRIPHFKFGGSLLRFKTDEIEAWARGFYREKKEFG